MIVQLGKRLWERLECVYDRLGAPQGYTDCEVPHTGTDVDNVPPVLDDRSILFVESIKATLLEDPDVHRSRNPEAFPSAETYEQRSSHRNADENTQHSQPIANVEQDRGDGKKVVPPPRREKRDVEMALPAHLRWTLLEDRAHAGRDAVEPNAISQMAAPRRCRTEPQQWDQTD